MRLLFDTETQSRGEGGKGGVGSIENPCCPLCAPAPPCLCVKSLRVVGKKGWMLLVAAAHEDVAEAAERVEDGAFVAALAVRTGVGQHAAGQAREGQRLQPNFAGAGQRRQEQSLAAEDCVLEAADKA